MIEKARLRTRISAVLVIIAVMFTSVGASIFYTNDTRQRMERERLASEAEINRARLEADREWCVIIATFVQTYRQQPPQNEIGRIIQREFERLYASRQCATVDKGGVTITPSGSPSPAST